MTNSVYIQDSRQYSTALRGVAIILILLNHCFGSFTRFVNPFGGIGVSLFLVLSGYGLNTSYLRAGGVSFESFWPKRLVKVWIPYFIIVSIYCLISEVGLASYIKQISLFQPSAPFWYIRYIFCCYVVFYFSSFIRNRFIRMAILFVAGMLTVFINGDDGQYCISFFLGGILSETFNKKEKSKGKIIPLAMFFGGILLLLIKHISCFDGSFIWNNVFSSLAFAGFSLALIFGLRYFNFTTHKLIVGFGFISYELYLVQMLFYWMIADNHMLVFPVIIGSIMLAWLLNKIDQTVSLRLIDKR